MNVPKEGKQQPRPGKQNVARERAIGSSQGGKLIQTVGNSPNASNGSFTETSLTGLVRIALAWLCECERQGQPSEPCSAVTGSGCPEVLLVQLVLLGRHCRVGQCVRYRTSMQRHGPEHSSGHPVHSRLHSSSTQIHSPQTAASRNPSNEALLRPPCLSEPDAGVKIF